MDISQSLRGVERAHGYSFESLMVIESDLATQNGVSVVLEQNAGLPLFPSNYWFAHSDPETLT